MPIMQKMQVEAEGILEVEEVALTNNVKELRFNMVKGDFKVHCADCLI